MKLLFIFSTVLSCLASFLACASIVTPWERYIENPTSANATAVERVEYSNSSENLNQRLERDLDILEYEIAAGDTASIKLAFRIRNQMLRSAAIVEFLDVIIGRGIRSNPKGYLQATASYKNDKSCVGASPSGDFFVDREAAATSERQARIAALKKVSDQSLREIRDQCILFLRKTGVQQTQ